jgi:hypothetical protein
MAENQTGKNGPAANGDDGSQPPAGRGSEQAPTPKPKDQVLSLAQLIGAPISALVDAEAQAAIATERFIRNVGFTGGADRGELGDLQMARFKRKRRDGEEEREIEVQIPLLSMLPIPALQIRDAELDYTVRVVQTEEMHHAPFHDVKGLRNTPDDEPIARIRGSFAREPHSGDRRRTDMLVKMKVRMEQADMPDGLAKLLALSSDSIQQKESDAPADTTADEPADDDK